MIERQDEELIVRAQQLEQKPLDGPARIHDALAHHAVADVEQHAEADGHPLRGELGDGLLVAVLENLERLSGQVRDEPALRIDDGSGDHDDVDARLEDVLFPDRLIHRGLALRQRDEGREGREGEGQPGTGGEHGANGTPTGNRNVSGFSDR